MNGLTVRRALDLLALNAGQTLAVIGAAGAVGGYAVQLGVAEGLRVIAVASTSDEPLMKQFGASVFVPRGDDMVAGIREFVPEGVDGLDRRGCDRSADPGRYSRRRRYAAVRGYEGESERSVVIKRVAVSEYARNTAALDSLARRWPMAS